MIRHLLMNVIKKTGFYSRIESGFLFLFEAQLGKLYQQIGETIYDLIPEEWKKLYLYAEVSEGLSYVYFYYYPEDNACPVYYLDIPERFYIDRREYKLKSLKLFHQFEELWKTFKEHDQEPWTNLTLFMDSSGKFKIDYDYEDLSDASPLHRRIIWKYRYLGMIPEEQEDRKFLEKILKKG